MSIKDLSKLKNISEKRICLLIRHAERYEIKDSEFGNDVLLTENGKKESEVLGNKLSAYNVIRIYTSPIDRCIQTAQFIKKGLKKNVEIVITNELGHPGFHVFDAELAGKTYKNQGFEKSYNDFIKGKLPQGWATTEYLKTHAKGFLESKTEECGITIFVTHDSLIANYAFANNIKKYDTKTDWVPYLDGIIIDFTNTKLKLKNFFTQYWGYLAVYTACKLNLFDVLQVPKKLEIIATEICADKNVLIHLLNALCSINFLQKLDEKYSLTELSALLTEKHPESLKYACMNWGEEHLTAWQQLVYTIKTGKNAFEKIYGGKFFDYLTVYEEKLDAYHKAMYEYAKDDYAMLCDKIDFSHCKSVMDCGGGYGAAISVIKLNNPNIKCCIFDLPNVVEKAPISEDIEKIGGNFFVQIPSMADTILLSRVLHDWDDDGAVQILKNCYLALPKNGILYVIENCAEKIKDIDFLSLSMSVICNSHERTSVEYIKLCNITDFEYKGATQLNDLQTILMFIKK